jgi:methyl-accepting chemotaxis protein
LLDALERSAEPLAAIQLGDPGLRIAVSLFLSSGSSLHAAANKATQMLAAHFQKEKEALEKREHEMTAALREIMQVIAVQSRDLASRSKQLSEFSHQMQSNAQETSQQAKVASEASAKIIDVVHSVATATEEVDATIHEISVSASSAAQIATEAVAAATESTESMSRLEKSSNDIGQVVKVISTVAQQTNLLALNATIEAARAGEAGKGFAVVAYEVKELAKETARATDEISRRIEAIQTDTHHAIKSIGKIQSIVDRLSITSNSIASAVEQQSTATKDIARNLTEASSGVSAISSGVSGVAGIAERTATVAAEGLTAASGLAQMAAELQRVAASVQS